MKQARKVLAMLIAVTMVLITVPTMTSAAEGDFTIEDGVLVGYSGTGGNVVIPNGVTGISHSLFSGNVSLTSVTIPDSVEYIGGDSFADCTSLTTVSIGKGVSFDDFLSSPSKFGSPFGGCTSLVDIKVNKDNEHITSDNGILFDKSKTYIIAYPQGIPDKYYEIPNTVWQISAGAFRGSSNLTEITIPDSVKFIRWGSFDDCKNLKSITIPATVFEMDDVGLGYFIGNGTWERQKIDGFTIHGVKDSAAERYATDNGFEFREAGSKAFKLGHVTGDERVTIGDALEILKYLAGMNSVVVPDTPSWNAARITGGEKPTIGDALEILKKLAGMSNLIDSPAVNA